MASKFKLKLKGKTAVFVDWANVYSWQESLKQKVDTEKLINYLKTYSQIKAVNFYFGTDKNPKSEAFLNKVKTEGYKLTTKPVKYILVTKVTGQPVYRRKCDFDIEICIDVHKLLDESFDSFVFFTGDGDFSPLYELLVQHKKQVVVIFTHGHMGREIYEMNNRVFTKAIDKMEEDLFF
jgi:uncharacterized LabA/DUF88 family protein